jgi:hypothetical protein
MLDRSPEDLVVIDALEVRELHVGVERSETVPLVETVVHGLHERKEHEERVDHRRREQEDEDGERAAVIAPSANGHRSDDCPFGRGERVHRRLRKLERVGSRRAPGFPGK